MKTTGQSAALRGFTLIELLVVIAIIGVLSSVVLASLNTARTRGNDAAIKSNLATIPVQAELYYDTNGNYGTVTTDVTTCSNANTFIYSDVTARNALNAATSSAAANGTCFLNGNGTNNNAYAISVPLRNGGHWCVDSTGFKGQIGSATADETCN